MALWFVALKVRSNRKIIENFVLIQEILNKFAFFMGEK